MTGRWGVHFLREREEESYKSEPVPPDDLDIVPWENVQQRFIIPRDIQEILGAPSPTIRVRIEIDAKQRAKHADSLHLYERLSIVLLDWQYWRRLEPEHHWEFVQFIREEGSAPWPLLIAIGLDQTGSFNLITMHRKNARWAKKMLEGKLGFRARRGGK